MSQFIAVAIHKGPRFLILFAFSLISGLGQVPYLEYAIVNVGSGLVLDNPNNSSVSGTHIQQWTYNGNPQQRWFVTKCYNSGATYCPNHSFNINSSVINPGLVLGIPSDNSSNGAPIQVQALQQDSAMQEWSFVPISGTRFFNIVNVYSGRYLDVPGDSQNNGSGIQEWTGDGSVQQEWMLVPTARSYILLDAGSPYGELDIQGGSMSNGGPVDLNNGPADPSNPRIVWSFIPLNGSNEVNIINQNSGLSLDVPGGEKIPGSSIQQWQLNGNLQQNWVLSQTPGTNSITITNEATGLVLETSGYGVHQAALSGSVQQQWFLDMANRTNPAAGVTSPVGNCSKSACSNSCNTANQHCTSNQTYPPNNGDCTAQGDHDLAVCIQNCPWPGSPGASYCADSCTFQAISTTEMCQAVQNSSNSCTYALQACQSECSQCTQN